MVRNRRFLRLWSAYSASVLGDQIYLLAVPLLVFLEGGTASTMALVKSCVLLPQAALGVFGGVIADRGNKIHLLRLTYLGSGIALLVALPGYLCLPDARLAVLAAAALVLSMFASVSAASVDGVLPHFAAREELARANSMTETTRTIATVIGPAAAGLLVASPFPGSVVLATGIAFTTAFVLLRGLDTPTPSKPKANRRATTLLQDLVVGVRYLGRSRRLFIGIFLSTSTNLVLGAHEAVLVYYFRSTLGMSAGWTGGAFAIAGAVSVATAVALAWRAPSRHYGRVMALSIVLQEWAWRSSPWAAGW
ncbi:MFS transporter [Streptomyces zagrosensis]|uniref:Uncharacterized protein YaaW (UPF0174 family) n=1 Tax=Streptomyces zagrosensis TaxID=1042984 RepID=A0A7W9QCZ5_9ACTN|nr:MFS transporter [Streptomyces zagrosensis]MBB5937836.1 uncharacterized protein YaaW (UPF0174 family) [Streptomyces zagrosensis]